MRRTQSSCGSPVLGSGAGWHPAIGLVSGGPTLHEDGPLLLDDELPLDDELDDELPPLLDDEASLETLLPSTPASALSVP
jgi:hypothetical protein